ncbi:hypothetical protein BTVI_69521 [Pitangus sulphuratus]|nr:hypothetical protein BTVI_69521 [Pitangus sulphuratus]
MFNRVTAGSKTDLLLAKTEPVTNGGSTFEVIDLREGKKQKPRPCKCSQREKQKYAGGTALQTLRNQYYIISSSDSEIECTLSKFADDTRVSNAVDLQDEWGAIQRNLNRLEEWTYVDLISINKANCKVLHMGQGKLQYQYKLGDEMVGAAL